MKKDENRPPIKVEKSILEAVSISVSIKIPAPPITGIARRNENLAACFESKPRSKAQLMVMPLLEIPGMIATA